MRLSTELVFAIGIWFYLTGAYFVFSGVNAWEQYECHHIYSRICDDDMVARDRTLAAFMAVVPPGWVAAFIATGGFSRGFSFEATAAVKEV